MSVQLLRSSTKLVYIKHKAHIV